MDPLKNTPFADKSRIERIRQAGFNPLSDITPERLMQQIQSFKAGQLYDLGRTIEAIEERDDVLVTVVPKARADVVEQQWDVLTVETSDPVLAELAKRQRAALKRTYDALVATDCMDADMEGELDLLIDQMLTAISTRYSCHHLQWVPLPARAGEEQGSYTVRATHVPVWMFEARTGRLRFVREPFGSWDGVDMAPNEWMVGVERAPLGIAESLAWMFKRLPLRDWLVYCARYGLPAIEGVTDAAEDTEEYRVVQEAVEAAGSEGSWIRNNSTKINLVDMKGSGQQPHPGLVERMDRALASMWRGADLSTMSAGSGSGEGASLQGAEQDKLSRRRSKWVAGVLNRRISTQVLRMVFGESAPQLAYFAFVSPEQQQISQDLAIDSFLLGAGHPISIEQAAERYGRPVPQQGSQLLRQPAPPMVAAANSRTPSTASVPEALVEELRQELQVPASWLSPIETVLKDLERLAQDNTVSDAALLAAAQDAARRMPELLKDMDVQALAQVFQRGLEASAFAGATDAWDKAPTPAKPAQKP